MKILIINGNKDRAQVNLGLGFLLQYIRNNNIIRVVSLAFHNPDEILNYIPEYELVGFSCLSEQFSDCISLAKKIKQHYKIPIIFGGIHATSCPEKVMDYKEVDFICVAEAEISFSLLLKELEKKTYNFSQVPGLVYRNKDNPALHNALSYLPPKFIDNLDIVGKPARDFLEYDRSKNSENIISSRGCLYHCTYCYNSTMNEIFGFKYRRRSVESVIEECIELKSEGAKSFSFSDDLFLTNEKWLWEFSKLYKEKVNIPFGCTARPEAVLANINSLKELRDSGLKSIWIGIESGSERIRKVILGRAMSNKMIIDAFRVVKELGIFTKSYNMVGIPTEGFMDAISTFLINLKIRPKATSYYTLIPYPGTKISKIANDLNLFRDKKYIYNDRINIQSEVDIRLGALDSGKMNRYHIVGFRYLWKFLFFRHSRKRIFLRLKYLYNSVKFFIIGFYKECYGIK